MSHCGRSTFLDPDRVIDIDRVRKDRGVPSTPDPAIAADGTRICFQVDGAGPALVLLSGQATDHHWWDRVRPDFSAHFTAVSLDHRGTGGSDRPSTPYSTRTLADDVVAVLDQLQLTRAHVYGTSMGGRVAQQVAIHHPDRLDKLVLGCTSPGGSGSVERTAEIRASIGQPDRAAGTAFLLDLMYTPVWQESHPGPYPVLGDPSMSPQDRRLHRMASDGHDAWTQLEWIAAPTLVLHGTDDRLNPTANAKLMADRIPDAALQLIPGARHAYFEEFRHVATPAVSDFLRS